MSVGIRPRRAWKNFLGKEGLGISQEFLGISFFWVIYKKGVCKD